MQHIQDLISAIKKYNPHLNEKRIRRAYKFAEIAHMGQKRKSGEDYILHPLAAAINLTRLQADEDTIIAALLHDVPEDTPVSLSLIKKQFGDDVSFLVKGVTKLSKVHYNNNMAERQIESLKKLLLHSAKDVRVIIIKLADRLHNMQTLDHVKKEKMERIAKETLEIYVPIANLLGIWDFKNELEDLCFRILFREEYDLLASKINANKKNYELYIKKTLKYVREEAKKQNIKILEMYGRQKNLFSIYKKLQKKKYTLNSINDLIGIRIICEDVQDCYRILGLLHNIFTLKPHRFKDYIALPKPNGYQSIHTCVFGLDGISTEFQIRTKKMNIEAEYGLAAHYFYSNENNKNKFNKSKNSWAKKILELKKNFSDPNSKVIDQLKLDIFQDRIFVFTPKGDIIDLPRSATCIDFAYAIHSDLGNHLNSVEINDQELPIFTELKSGDKVKIINGEGFPALSWLDYAKTGFAKTKIKEAIRKESREIKIKMGKEKLKKELYLTKSHLINQEDQSLYRKTLITSGYKNIEDLYIAISEGKVNLNDIIEKSLNTKNYNVGVRIDAENRVGLFQDILSIFKELNIDISSAAGKIHKKNNAVLKVYATIHDINQIRKIFDHISSIRGVKKIQRITPYKNIFLFLGFSMLFAFSVIHPYLVKYFITEITPNHPIIHDILPYTYLVIIYLYTLSTELLFKMSLPDKEKRAKIWIASICLSLISLTAVIIEIIIFNLPLFKIIFGLGVIVLYLNLYIIYKREKKQIESF